MKLNLAIFVSWDVVFLSLVVIALAILTKFIGCGLGALGMGRRQAIQVGVGMIPRGEVGIVVAQIGFSLAVVSDAVYGVVLAMSVITTIAAPPLIKAAFSREPANLQDREYDVELEEEIG
jgi:Kef-type K+ transport system membrane component KefB